MKLSFRILGVGLLLLGVITLLSLPAFGTECRQQSVAEKIAELSVTVKAGEGEASGVLFRSHVMTMAHVVADLRSETDGKESFRQAKVIQVVTEDGDEVARYEVAAAVVRYDAKADLALLKLYRPMGKSAVFWLEKNPPPLASKLYACGSYYGSKAEHSLSAGVLARHGRKLNGRLFDQTDCTTFPGSSGSGVFLQRDGRLLGLVYGGRGEGCTLFIPARVIVSWCKENKAEFILGADAGCCRPCDCPDCPCGIGGSCSCNAKTSTKTNSPESLPRPRAALSP